MLEGSTKLRASILTNQIKCMKKPDKFGRVFCFQRQSRKSGLSIPNLQPAAAQSACAAYPLPPNDNSGTSSLQPHSFADDWCEVQSKSTELRFSPLRVWILIWCVALLAGSMIYPVSGRCGGGHIQGRISLTMPDGTVAYADWVRVLLVSERVEVDAPGDINGLDRAQQYDRIITAHIEFFKKVLHLLNEPGYLVAETLTTPDGRFKFYDFRPGNYQVVVTFPAMIKGYKVAWQVPATIQAGQSLSIVLNDKNMLLPTYRRK